MMREGAWTKFNVGWCAPQGSLLQRPVQGVGGTFILEGGVEGVATQRRGGRRSRTEGLRGSGPQPSAPPPRPPRLCVEPQVTPRLNYRETRTDVMNHCAPDAPALICPSQICAGSTHHEGS